jgi:hypothetical protein
MQFQFVGEGVAFPINAKKEARSLPWNIQLHSKTLRMLFAPVWLR